MHDHYAPNRRLRSTNQLFCLQMGCKSMGKAVLKLKDYGGHLEAGQKRKDEDRDCEFSPNTTLHCNNLAESIPCTTTTCEFGIAGQSCTNMMVSSDAITVRPVDWIHDSGKAEQGLFCMASHVPVGSWVASFGAMRESVSLRNAIGYCVEVQVMAPQRWGPTKKLVAPCAGWERAGHKAPFINHSCCEEHVNCEYVSTDEDEKGVCSVNVRTIRDIQSRGQDGGVELLVHFGLKFVSMLPTGRCECCACMQRTEQCRPMRPS